MDTLDGSENNAKISDSAYSNSCSNSQSRRSHSSKSTNSGSNCSGSSGYGGNPSTSGYGSSNTPKPLEQRRKSKDRQKKKGQVKSPKVEITTTEVQVQVECDIPEPVNVFEVSEEEQLENVLKSPRSYSHLEKGAESMDICSASSICINEEGSFSCVISMLDGVVMYTSSTITGMLGYPKEMWIGRSFLDFVHERDHDTFASQISSGVAMPKKSNGIELTNASTQVNTTTNVVCRLRRYRGLSCGFVVKRKAVTYSPFLLKFSFKEISDKDGDCVYLVVQATPFFSAFKTPYEIIPKAVPFVIRHTANGIMEYIDVESVPYLGYLPQDLKNKNALQLYHPHDLDFIQHVYETTIREGSVARCSPYRIMAQNGDFLTLETEWSSFINPWSRKLEFVTGKHHIVQGPKNPDVFQPPNPDTMFKLNEEDTAKTQCMRENIVRIMNEVLTKPAQMAKQQMARRCEELATFMETLLEDTAKSDDDDLPTAVHDHSFYERDSELLGCLSPHNDYLDSESSTDSPVGYDLLNYNDTLQRYFDSHQSCTFEEMITVSDDNIYGFTDLMPVSGNLLPPFGSLGHGSSHTSMSLMRQGFKPKRLTESLLKKHNAEMERELVRLHRETRPTTRSEREKAAIERRQKKREHLARCNANFQPTSAGLVIVEAQPHGVKRPSSKTSESEMVAQKHQCIAPRQPRRSQAPGVSAVHTSAAVTTTVATSCSTTCPDGMNTFVLGLGVPPNLSVVSPANAMPGMIPVYYTPQFTAPITSPAGLEAGDSGTRPPPYQHQAMPCMMYGQGMFGAPMMYTPIVSPVAYDMHQNLVNHNHQQCINNASPLILARRNYEEACKPGVYLRKKMSSGRPWHERKMAQSRGMLRNMDGGSGSSSSAETSNRSTDAIADGNKRQRFSKKLMSNNEEIVDRTDGESSYYSYSSFFKTDSGSAEDSDARKSGNKGNDLPISCKTKPITDTKYGVKEQMKNVPKRSKVPPWMEEVCLTPALIYKYQVASKNLEEVLASDRKKLQTMEQPALVNDQLAQLYVDLQRQGVSAKLNLEEDIASQNNSVDEPVTKPIQTKYTKCRIQAEYSKMVMVYEENAPFPPPEDDEKLPCPQCS